MTLTISRNPSFFNRYSDRSIPCTDEYFAKQMLYITQKTTVEEVQNIAGLSVDENQFSY